MRRSSGITLVVLCLGSACSAQDSPSAVLAGTWDDITPQKQRFGYRMPQPKVSLTILGTSCTWQEDGGGAFRQSLFVLGDSNPDRLIDFVTVSGGRFHTTHALFKVEGDILTIKEAGLDRPRPVDLVSEDLGALNVETWCPVSTYKRRAKGSASDSGR